MSLKAYVVSDSNASVVVANMTELERIEALEDEVYELKAQIKSLNSELNKAERKAYTGLGDQWRIDTNGDILIAHKSICVLL